MKICYSIDTMSIMDVHMRHMHAVVLINDVHGFIVIFIFYAQIQFMNDRHDLARTGCGLIHFPAGYQQRYVFGCIRGWLLFVKAESDVAWELGQHPVK